MREEGEQGRMLIQLSPVENILLEDIGYQLRAAGRDMSGLAGFAPHRRLQNAAVWRRITLGGVSLLSDRNENGDERGQKSHSLISGPSIIPPR